MVHDAESEPASNDASASMHDMMADLPPLLLGTYTPKIDAKGRMALPAKFRSQLGPGMVMARGQERCVYLLPQMEFRRIAMQIQRTSMGNKAAREYLRVFLSGAVDQDPDKQGRVLVPQMLRDYANRQRHRGDRRGNPSGDLEQAGMGGISGRQGTGIFRYCR